MHHQLCNNDMVQQVNRLKSALILQFNGNAHSRVNSAWVMTFLLFKTLNIF